MTTTEAILITVGSHPGVNNVKLALDVMGIVNPMKFEENIYQGILNKLVKDKEILELEYILPEAFGIVKSIYFPKGTAFVLDRLQ